MVRALVAAATDSLDEDVIVPEPDLHLHLTFNRVSTYFTLFVLFIVSYVSPRSASLYWSSTLIFLLFF